MTQGHIGYITKYNTSSTDFTVVNHSSQRALNTVALVRTANMRVEVLPNGTKVNYDGTSTAPRTPGLVVQDVRYSTGGATWWATWIDLLGTVGTLTLTTIAATTKTATAALINVEDISPATISSRAVMSVRLTWDALTVWDT